jgi:GTP-binding protein
MFIDLARIYVKGGQGGSGACSFRREKHVDKGGPDGGDGGRGGSVIFVVDPHLHTLLDFKYKQHYVARHGQHGMGKKRHGRAAQDIIVRIPLGTVVKDAESEEVLADLTYPVDTYIAARGGKGGRGNARFVTPTHQAPRQWEVGDPGEERTLILELKLLADIGLVGKPNAGKSTLLSKLSAARPKIADYPFTTLQPNIGIVKVEEYKSFVMADIPGLIEGAHRGKGLGHQFLRHIERTRVIVYLIDPSQDDPKTILEVLQSELEKYDKDLLNKPYLLVLTKKDTWSKNYAKIYSKRFDVPVISISSLKGDGLNALKWSIWRTLETLQEDETDN